MVWRLASCLALIITPNPCQVWVWLLYISVLNSVFLLYKIHSSQPILYYLRRELGSVQQRSNLIRVQFRM